MLNFLLDLFKPKPAVAPAITSETSMNFDARDVGPFLNRLAAHTRFALPRDFADAIVTALPELSLDQTRRWRVDGDFDGTAMVLEIEVIMDDVNAPDISFFSSAQVIKEIDGQLEQFDESAG